jgi:hypothetical protein
MSAFPEDPWNSSKDSKVKRNKYGDIVSDSDSWSFEDGASNNGPSNKSTTSDSDAFDTSKGNSIDASVGTEDTSQSKLFDQMTDMTKADATKKKILIHSFLNLDVSRKAFICSQVGLSGMVIAGVVGGAVGGVQGAFEGFRYQLHQQPGAFRPYVMQVAMSKAFTYGGKYSIDI